MMFKFALMTMVFIFGFQSQGQNEEDHKLVRRLTVFPISVSSELSDSAENAWWKLREVITENKRFLVASKNFMVQKDVFQARRELSPADVIILAKLLDADALMTTYLKNKKLIMNVYGGQYGRVLWKHQFKLQPSIPVAQQIRSASNKLALDFISSIPYQGFVMTDSLKGQPIFNEAGEPHFFFKQGKDSKLQVDDPIQIIRVYNQNFRPLFIDGGVVQVLAEGNVIEISGRKVKVRLTRSVEVSKIKEGALVKAPREFARLRDSYALRSGLDKYSAKILSPDLRSVHEESVEEKPLVTSLTFIANIAAFLLLAF